MHLLFPFSVVHTKSHGRSVVGGPFGLAFVEHSAELFRNAGVVLVALSTYITLSCCKTAEIARICSEVDCSTSGNSQTALPVDIIENGMFPRVGLPYTSVYDQTWIILINSYVSYVMSNFCAVLLSLTTSLLINP